MRLLRRGFRAPSTAESPTIIRTKGLGKRFGEQVALEDLTFEVPRGSIFGLIGPSGCGKTTTVRLLTGTYVPTAGELTVLGRPPVQFSQRLRTRLGYMPQQFVLYPELTVWENLNFAASMYGVGLRRAGRLNELLDFVELGEHRHKLARQLSGGMQRRLSLAATLVHDPVLLFLDEPTAGIDPVLRRKLWDHFQSLQQRERTLLITTQYVGEAAYCDLVAVLVDGRLAVVDSPLGLRRRAYGGEIVDVRTGERLSESLLQELIALPFVRKKITRLDDRTLRIVVEDASTAIPQVLAWLQQKDVPIESVQEHMPPFDDVFVELVNGEAAHA